MQALVIRSENANDSAVMGWAWIFGIVWGIITIQPTCLQLTIVNLFKTSNCKCSLKLSSWWSFVMITFNIWLSSRILLLWIWYSYFSARCLQVCFLVVLMLFASVVLLWGLFKAVCPSVSLYTHLFVRACVCACPETGGQVSTACSVCPLHCVLQVIYCFPMLLCMHDCCTHVQLQIQIKAFPLGGGGLNKLI